ncbi:MAG: ATP-binding protein [Lachnospiraceae bacterium]|nr:ATP-binding protein [Lachnospiraceae bacterium]
MLKRFSVSNYRCFRDAVEMVFDNIGTYNYNEECILNGLLGKAIIYGRNATGKTNLGKAVSDIRYILYGNYNGYESTLNANSDKDESSFCYEFQFGSKEVVYEYAKDRSGELVHERLEIEGSTMYSLSLEDAKFEQVDLELAGTETIQTDRYIESLKSSSKLLGMRFDNNMNRIPFLRYILSNTALDGASVLRQLESYVLRMRLLSVQDVIQNAGRATSRNRSSFVEYLNESDNLERFESFLNQMGVPCKLKIIERDNMGFLYFDLDKPIRFFTTASSGTLALTSFYQNFMAYDFEPSFLYMDEFDAFYHYEMSESLVRYIIKSYPNTQVVFTTHNTNLMTNQLMRPDCLLILSRDGRITALRDATGRELREGHNLEKLYIAGEFEQYE